MAEPHSRQNIVVLLSLLFPASAYLGWQYYLPTLTGRDLLDGSIGVLLGLYICSHPAANSIDLIFLERGGFRRMLPGRSATKWLIVNALVMLIGWFVIVIGVARFTHGPT
jgi:hypothetical protein